MNATFIVNSKSLKKYYENRDCQIWQPLTLISEDILAYIEKAGNQQSRLERFAAYSLLFYLAEKFFGIKILSIGRDEFGKPYIKDFSVTSYNTNSEEQNSSKNISFNISHSCYFSAVTISDEGECGVDIQALPERKTIERVEERFLRGVSFDENLMENSFVGYKDLTQKENNHSSLPSLLSDKLYLAEPNFEGFSFNECLFNSMCEDERGFFEYGKDQRGDSEFLKKWTAIEAILKCHGKGFRELDLATELYKKSSVMYGSLLLSGIQFGITVAKRNFKM